MKFTSIIIQGLVAPMALAIPANYERKTATSPSAHVIRDEAGTQGFENGFPKIGEILHVFDVVFDGGLRLIPGLDCLVPDPQYDGLPGSKGNNHGKPDCKSLKTVKDKLNEAKYKNSAAEQ